jgi:PTS system ascorbate-specific IIA component
MIGILVVSHEPLGTALIRCTRHIFGRLPPQLAALDVIPDEDPTAATQAARELLDRINDGSGVLVLTDVFGATPSRIAMSLADPRRVAVLAGVNLPILVKALGNRRVPLDTLVGQLVESGRNAIFLVEPPAPEAAPATTPATPAAKEGHA